MTKTIRASELPLLPRNDLVPGLLFNDVVLLAGREKTAKSQLVAHWAACITTGAELVPGVKPRARGDVIVFNGERSWQRAVIPRLAAAGADLHRVHLPKLNNNTLGEAADTLRELLVQHPKTRLVIVDPLNAYLDGASPTNARVRKLLRPFLELSDAHDVCVVLVHHFNKARHKDLIGLIGGSGGWTQAVCSVWATAKVKDGYLLEHATCNFADTTGQTWEYVTETIRVFDGKKELEPTSRVVIGDKSEMDIATALEIGKDAAHTSPHRAAHEIEKLLRGKQPVLRSHVIQHLEKQGLGARHTLKRAQEHLQGRLEYITKGRNTLWTWAESESESNGDEWDSDSQ